MMADLSNGTTSPRSASCASYFDDFVKKPKDSKPDDWLDCFQTFDTDRDGFLSKAEFGGLLECLFKKNGKSHPIEEKTKDAIFTLIDENEDNRIDLEEFKICWTHWMKQVLHPVSALLIIDVQNDFISGTLAIKDCPACQDGEAVVSPINYCLDNAPFHTVVYSSDWHPSDHISFIENVKKRKMHHTSKISATNAKKLDTVIFAEPQLMDQKLWPAHCVQKTWGSELHKDLKIVKNALYVNKGTNSDIDSYSAFWDNKKLSQTKLVKEITEKGVTDIYVCGLAYDVCVAATTCHSLEHGFRTVLVEDCCRGVDQPDIDAARERLQKQGAIIVNSEDVPAMVSGEDRRPELGHFSALNLAMARKLLKQDTANNATNDKGNNKTS